MWIFPPMIKTHAYSNINSAHRGMHPAPHFRHSDHISLFLYPAYRQRLTQTNPVTEQVKLWTPDAESTLQDCSARADWDVFKAAVKGWMDGKMESKKVKIHTSNNIPSGSYQRPLKSNLAPYQTHRSFRDLPLTVVAGGRMSLTQGLFRS